MRKGSLRRIVKFVTNSLSKVQKTVCMAIKEHPLSLASIFILVFVASWGLNNCAGMTSTRAQATISAIERNAVTVQKETTTTATTTTATTATSTTVIMTTATTITTTEDVSTDIIVETAEAIQVDSIRVDAIKIESDEASKSDEESKSDEASELDEESKPVKSSQSVEDSTEYVSVGQYGYAIDSEEYVYLAQVIEHEGSNCSVEVKEHIGICLLNRTYAPGFKDSVHENKEASGQYFSGWYNYTEESASIAVELIEAYNTGAEYWSQYCSDRNLTWDTKYQRNDFPVPGTQEVYRETASTSGGYQFTMVYSR